VATDLPEAGPTPQSRGCTVTVWPEEVANIKQGTGWLRGGFSLRIEGSESWSSWRWVPYPSAYAQIVLPPGDQLLEIKYDVDRGRTDRTSGHVVQCLPGEFLYLAVAASSATLDNGSVEWRVVEADRATQEMAGKACVIPPDATGDAPAQPAISIG
jgi:hypothetical protein